VRRSEIIVVIVVQARRQPPGVQVEVFWSGQHIELATGLLDQFRLDVIHNGTAIMAEPGLAGKFGLMAQQVERLLQETTYDWIVVQGDTAAAAAGFMNRVPVAHVEAGLRTGNLYSPWPENLTARASRSQPRSTSRQPWPRSRTFCARACRRRGCRWLATRWWTLCSTPVNGCGRGHAPRNLAVSDLPQYKKLILATLHRRENIGAPIREVLRALRDLGKDGDKVIAPPVQR